MRKERHMVRTLNPNDVVDQFAATVGEARDRYLDMYAILESSPSPKLSLRKSLTTDLAFRVGTEWELFQHRWHLASISNSPAAFVAWAQAELDAGLAKGPARHILDTLWEDATTVPPRLSVEQIDALIDPDGYNVTFKDGEAWAAKAQLHLAPKHAALVCALVSTPEDESLVALLKAVRNAIAHNSSNGLALLNRHVRSRPVGERVGLIGSANTPLLRDGAGQIRDIPTYLHKWSMGAHARRVTVLTTRIVNVASRLRI